MAEETEPVMMAKIADEADTDVAGSAQAGNYAANSWGSMQTQQESVQLVKTKQQTRCSVSGKAKHFMN